MGDREVDQQLVERAQRGIQAGAVLAIAELQAASIAPADMPEILPAMVSQIQANQSEMAAIDAQTEAKVHALAVQLGYDGTLTVGAGSLNSVTGDSTRAPTWPIHSWTPCPTPTMCRPGKSRSTLASSIAVRATLRSGTG